MGREGRREFQEVNRLTCPLSRLQGGTSFPGRAPLSQKGLMAPSSMCPQKWSSSEALSYCFAMTGSHAFLPLWTGRCLHGSSPSQVISPRRLAAIAHGRQTGRNYGSEHPSSFPQFFTPQQLPCPPLFFTFLQRHNSQAVKLSHLKRTVQ